MGLFGKLFEKKNCDICGAEIGLLGNRKLEDGNCCKDCASRLSPWFSERRSSTVAEIKEQLEYRRANEEAVAAFQVTRTMGEDYKVLLDEDARKFIVTRARNYREVNPDVLDYSQVTGCELDIEEDRDEVYREVPDDDGSGTKKVSYSPRRYTYSYDFYMIIHVNHPWFDRMKFKINDSDVEVETGGRSAFGMARLNRLEGSPTPPTQEERRGDVEYARYEQMGTEIREALTQVRDQHREDVEAANAPRQAVTCPWCGATTTPDANGCCEYCGGSLKN